MAEFFDKDSVYKILIKPVKLFRRPKAKDKIDALILLKPYADLRDLEYVYPLVYDKNVELALTAAETVSEIMKKIRGKHWNGIYDVVKYIKIELETMAELLNFTPEVSAHLLGIATLNSSGFAREKALKLISGIKCSSIVPYILLRLNDWVMPVRSLAEHVLKGILSAENIEVFIDNSYLITKLQNVSRTDLRSVVQKILDYIKDDALRYKLKGALKHPEVKTRFFCYTLLSDVISFDEDIINFALKDKSFEIRMWLVEAIKNLENDKRNTIIGKLLKDKSAKVKTAVLRNFADVVCSKFRESVYEFLTDGYSSVRDEARFICKKHSFIKDFAEFYRQQISINPVQGAVLGLGETGIRSDFNIVSKLCSHIEPKIRHAALMAMWYLSKEDAVIHVLDSLDSDVPKIRKTAKQFLKSSKLPAVLIEMRKKLESDNVEIKLFALDAVSGYGGWLALEGILFAISNDIGQVLNRAKDLLHCWVLKSSRLYSRPDAVIRKKIIELIESAESKGLLSESVLKELNFIIETRR